MVEQSHQTFTSIHTLEHRKKEIKVIESCCSIFSYVPFFVVTLMFLNPASAELVRETSFEGRLNNPCGVASDNTFRASRVSAANRLAQQRNMIGELNMKARLINESATSIYTNNVFSDCSQLRLPEVTDLPNLERVTEFVPMCGVVEMNKNIHVSVLNVTAHIYYIAEQLEKYSGDACGEDQDALLEKTRALGLLLRDFLCTHRMYMVLLTEDGNDNDVYTDSFNRVLEQNLVDQMICSRRLLRDCQTMQRAVKLFNNIAKFNFPSTDD